MLKESASDVIEVKGVFSPLIENENDTASVGSSSVNSLGIEVADRSNDHHSRLADKIMQQLGLAVCSDTKIDCRCFKPDRLD